jgi:predicted lysophospholipase L1 biosynthesis ABC-type transport system permease subunit
MMPLALRYAWRELRGGLRGFGVFVACIALGVMAIAGVGSVAQSLADGLSRAGGVILGGDLAFSLVQREANDSERSFVDAHGAVSVAGMLPTMARARDERLWSRSRRSMTPIRSWARSRPIPTCRFRRSLRAWATPSAPPPIRPC